MGTIETKKYYDHSGVKHTGFVDFGNNLFGSVKINFKNDSVNAENQHLDLSAITSIVVIHSSYTSNGARGGSNLHAPNMATDSLVFIHETTELLDTTTTNTWLCKFVTGAVNANIYSREVKRSGGGFGVGAGTFGALSLAVGVSMSYTKTLYLCEANGKAIELRRSNYKQILATAFADYPELSQKIQNKQLKFGELDDIIKCTWLTDHRKILL